MEEKIGRETLLELIQLQIKILDDYKELLNTGEGGMAKEAKDALNKVIKAGIDAVGPILTLQHKAYGKAVGLHGTAVQQTRDLLQKLLDEEKARAKIRTRMQEDAERARHKRGQSGGPLE